jgi:hypothetical protein
MPTGLEAGIVAQEGRKTLTTVEEFPERPGSRAVVDGEFRGTITSEVEQHEWGSRS